MLNEKRKFLAFETVKRKKKFNMAKDYPKVSKYIYENFGIYISKEEYFELVGSYPELRKKYFKWLDLKRGGKYD